MAKPCTPHPIAQRVQFFKIEAANVNLSLGGPRGIFSFEKENIPLDSCSAIGAAIPPPPAWSANRKKEDCAFAQPPLMQV